MSMTISLNRLDEELQLVEAQLQARMRDLETKLAQIEAQQRATQAELDAVHQTFRQLASFPEANRGQRICIHCWLQQVRSPLETKGRGTDTEDFFTCPTCKREYSEAI